MNAHIIRTYQDDCTEGVFVLIENGKLLLSCNILELPNKGNKRSISCIPEGTYKVTPHVSEKFGKCFWVNNVPNRSAILIHAGNTVADTRGCLLPGTHTRKGKVIGSRAMLEKIRELAPEGFTLQIYEK